MKSINDEFLKNHCYFYVYTSYLKNFIKYLYLCFLETHEVWNFIIIRLVSEKIFRLRRKMKFYISLALSLSLSLSLSLALSLSLSLSLSHTHTHTHTHIYIYIYIYYQYFATLKIFLFLTVKVLFLLNKHHNGFIYYTKYKSFWVTLNTNLTKKKHKKILKPLIHQNDPFLPLSPLIRHSLCQRLKIVLPSFRPRVARGEPHFWVV